MAEVLSLVAGLTEAECFTQVLTLRGYCDLDSFVQTMAKCSPAFEKIQQELSVEVIQEIIRIAGWVRLDWQKIHGIIATI